MKYLTSSIILPCILLTLNISAQQISSKGYNKELIHEDFNEKGDYFKIITDADNYFILDNGDYLLSRNNEESDYPIIANHSSASNFILKTSIRIGPDNNKNGSLGVILKSQKDGKGAIIFEINKKGEYRIKQTVEESHKILSGINKTEGWVQNSAVNKVDEHNLIEIRTENNIYDVYINKQYITTFFIPDYDIGICGLIISPATKARVSYYYLYAKGEHYNQPPYTKKNTSKAIKTDSTASESELDNKNTTLIKEIESLETKNAKLSESIKELNSELTITKEALSKIKQEQTDQVKLLEENNTTLKDELTKTKQEQTEKIQSLKATNNTLQNNSKKLEKEVRSLKEEIRLKSSINNELKQASNKNTQELNTKIKNLNSEINKLNISSKTLSDKLAEKEKTNKKRIQKEKKSTATLKTKINSLNQEISLKTSINSEVTNDLEKLKQSSNKQIQKLNSEIKDLTSEVSRLKKSNLTVDKLNSELDKSNTEIDLLKNKINGLNELIVNLKTEISELKDLFIQKDFELNGVKISKEEQSNKIIEPTILKGKEVVYSVQFGVFMQEQTNKSIDNIKQIWYNTNDKGAYIYYSGWFDSPEQATNHKNSLIRKGYKNAFVVTLTK